MPKTKISVYKMKLKILKKKSSSVCEKQNASGGRSTVEFSTIFAFTWKQSNISCKKKKKMAWIFEIKNFAQK